jgi:hypothetical protein
LLDELDAERAQQIEGLLVNDEDVVRQADHATAPGQFGQASGAVLAIGDPNLYRLHNALPGQSFAHPI